MLDIDSSTSAAYSIKNDIGSQIVLVKDFGIDKKKKFCYI